jgi:hypothetical protein
MLGVARGLCAMHGKEPPIVHCDVKDENIFLTLSKDDGSTITGVKLGDLSSAQVGMGEGVHVHVCRALPLPRTGWG